jgi:hypothetical protein
MPCLFCEKDFDEAAGRKRTREHIYGDWMRPHLEDVIGPGTHTRTKSTFEDLEADKRTYRGFPAQQTVQGVCEVCNNGWLSDVQAAARPTLLPLFTKPRRRVVGVEAQRALVTWAYRAALLVGVKAGDAAIPKSDLHDFFRTREPPVTSEVVMVLSAHRGYTYLDHRLIRVQEAGQPRPVATNGSATLVCVGHAGFYVVRWDDVKPQTGLNRLYGSYRRSVATIRPSDIPVLWPPQVALDHHRLDSLANVIGAWEPR